ncbi:MAG: hypothetical protein ACI89W_001558 [Gammaproteobacteria bacterium]
MIFYYSASLQSHCTAQIGEQDFYALAFGGVEITTLKLTPIYEIILYLERHKYAVSAYWVSGEKTSNNTKNKKQLFSAEVAWKTGR